MSIDLDAQAKSDQPVEMVDLFHLNGKTYQVQGKPRVNLALKFMWQRKTVGELEAASNLLVEMLGEEAFQTLMEYEDLTPEILEQVCSAASKVAMGELETATGNSGSGPTS